MQNQKNKHLTIYSSGDKLAYKDLVETGFINKIDKYYKINWIFSNAIDLKFIRVKKFNIVKVSKFYDTIFTFMFLLETKLHYEKASVKWIFPMIKLKGSLKNIYYLITVLKLEKISIYLCFLIRKIICRTSLINRNSKIFIFIGSSKDPLFLPLMSEAQKMKIKKIHIPINWDNATTKAYCIKPDIVFTWGKQTSELSKKIHNIDSFPIGSLRMEKHNKHKMNKSKLFSKYNLNEKYHYLLFAGSGVAYDEIEILKIIDSICIKNKQHKVKIIYKEHPYPHKRKVNKNSQLKQLKNIIEYKYLDNFSKKNLNFRETELFNLIDAVISPYSTMIVEGLLNGKPILALSIKDKIHKEYDWENCTNLFHLRILNNQETIIQCNNISDLEQKFIQLISCIGDKQIIKKAKKLSNEIVHSNNISYIKKFKDLIEMHMPH